MPRQMGKQRPPVQSRTAMDFINGGGGGVFKELERRHCNQHKGGGCCFTTARRITHYRRFIRAFVFPCEMIYSEGGKQPAEDELFWTGITGRAPVKTKSALRLKLEGAASSRASDA